MHLRIVNILCAEFIVSIQGNSRRSTKGPQRCSQEKPEEIRRESGQLQTGNEGTNNTAEVQNGQGPQDKEKLTDDNCP